jgi:hypothetical protein
LASSCYISFFYEQILMPPVTYLSALQLFALVISAFLTQALNTLGFFNLKFLELSAVVHGLFDSFVDGNKLFVVLHFLKPGGRLDLGGFDCATKLSVQFLHLVLVVVLEQLDFLKGLVFKLSKLVLPRSVEVSEEIVSNCDVFAHLSLLNVGAKLVLVLHNLLFQKAHFTH